MRIIVILFLVLVSVTSAQASKYLADPIVDEFLDQYDVKEIVKKKKKGEIEFVSSLNLR